MTTRSLATTLLLILSSLLTHAAPPADGEHIVLLGNGLGERMVDHPYFEAELQLRFPNKHLVVRNMCRSGDTPGFRPHPSRKSQWAFPGAEKFRPQNAIHKGQGHHPTPDEWLTTLKADTIIAFFGYNESFDGPAGLVAFKGELDAFITHTAAQKYNGKSAPRLILASPIAFENLSSSRDLPDGSKENANLTQYTTAMREVAAKHKIQFIDLFNSTAQLYPTLNAPFTRNGFLPNDGGYKFLGKILSEAAYAKSPYTAKGKGSKVLEAILEKNWFWFNDNKMLNGVHVDGRRFKPFGPANYPAETSKIRAMTEARDQNIWAVANGRTFDLNTADDATPTLPEVKTNYKASDPNYTPAEDAVKSLTVPEGYKIELFASEQDFPNLANPVQMSFDNKGRLWVACMPSYPHYKPGDTKPDDKLIIYEDTNNDGKADKETVFADGLHLPIGFELAPEGVYLSQEPHLMLLRDTNGDDKADVREVVLTGFDSHDTHHAISAYAADGSGAFMLCEGVFLHSNVETPYGPVRGVDGGFYRFSPQRTRLERTAQLSIPNPWGAAFDEWGQDFFLHTSGSSVNWMLPASVKPIYGAKTPSTASLVPKGQNVRPTSGIEFVSSRHFPDEVQGDFILCNSIGFLGIKQHSIVDDGTGYKTAHRHDLLKSSDGNFRPVDLEFAPDGSLYVVDWHNVLIGHMQHNARDPHRDHVHGRIYRITYPSRPLVKPAAVDGAPLATLIENLKLPETRSRYRSRRELREHPSDQVVSALGTWTATLDSADPRYEHHLLEALWTTWGLNAVDQDLLRHLLKAKDFRVRCAAVRVLRYTTHLFPDHRKLLMAAANDPEGRVRLEAVIAASWMNNGAAKKIVAAAKAHPLDHWNKNAVNTAEGRLAGAVEVEVDEHPAPPVPSHLKGDDAKRFLAGHEIYYKEGYCTTCHQPDGKGLPNAGFPPIADTAWAQGSDERLIKITLHGLIGPIEVKGQKYPGQVPMTPFGGLLNDEDVASVLTYVRNNFGNNAPAVSPDTVQKVRAETGQRIFYTPEELLKDHPHEK